MKTLLIVLVLIFAATTMGLGIAALTGAQGFSRFTTATAGVMGVFLILLLVKAQKDAKNK